MTRFVFFVFTVGLFCLSQAPAQSIDIFGPAGSWQFGKEVKALPNGNFVVTNPLYDSGAIVDAGAVHLYNGASGALIGTMTGIKTNDQVGSGGITVLPSGDFLVRSPLWDTPGLPDVTAITRCSGATGCPATVTSANSLTGSRTGDNIGSSVVILAGGNYVIASPSWDNTVNNADAGAVTWCNKTGCPTGSISQSNSLVGTRTGDAVGEQVFALATGNYVVRSVFWDNGAGTVDAGAVTFGNGTTGITGAVSIANSLVGGQASDLLGVAGVYALPNGNYLVASPSWNNLGSPNVGAVTFASGTSGVSGAVNSSNSLTGRVPNDAVGEGVTVLSNGNYVVTSPQWNNGAADVGAATWCNGTTGLTGTVMPSNSVIGSSAGDRVGSGGAAALTNGNYVVLSFEWTNGSGSPVGASTWADGTGAASGVVSLSNSLAGTRYYFTSGGPGPGVTPLANGNYVVRSPVWNNGAINEAGAATLCGGNSPCAGFISESNSLVGSNHGDRVSEFGVTALTNGNYVVNSPNWTKDGQLASSGAVTWGSGTAGIVGPVTTSNSIYGGSALDRVGMYGVTPLTNGNYVVVSRDWRNQGVANAGAVTWGNGGGGTSGEVGAANSLVGTAVDEGAGQGGVTALTNGNYVVGTPQWNNGSATRAGAVTWADGTVGITGTISPANSLVGSTINDNVGQLFSVTALNDGNYMVHSSEWDNGPIGIAGAMTRCNGTVGKKGTITAQNSVVGITDGGGHLFNFVYDAVNNQFLVGHPSDNTVTLYRMAATGSLSGRVTDANGTPIRNALVTLTAPGGERRAGQTGQLGFYVMDGIPTGQLYTVSISAKRYRFIPSRPLFVDADIGDYNFTARPNEF